jgi:hypothetical protein
MGVLALAALVLGASLAWTILSVARPRRWRSGLRRMRRRLLGPSWRPVLMRPYTPPAPPSADHPP